VGLLGHQPPIAKAAGDRTGRSLVHLDQDDAPVL
jgi:hypothetical protein